MLTSNANANVFTTVAADWSFCGCGVKNNSSSDTSHEWTSKDSHHNLKRLKEECLQQIYLKCLEFIECVSFNDHFKQITA